MESETRGLPRSREFTVTEDHLKLARHLNVDWDGSEYDGAPEIHLKRPYGSQGACYIGELLGWPEWSDELEAEALRIHREMETALQIFLHTGEFRAGVYARKQGRWEPVLAPDEELSMTPTLTPAPSAPVAWEPSAALLALKVGDAVLFDNQHGMRFTATVMEPPDLARQSIRLNLDKEYGFYPLRHVTPLTEGDKPAEDRWTAEVREIVRQGCGLLNADSARILAAHDSLALRVRELTAENHDMHVSLQLAWDGGETASECISRLIRERGEKGAEVERLKAICAHLDHVLPGNGPLVEKADEIVGEIAAVRGENAHLLATLRVSQGPAAPSGEAEVKRLTAERDEALAYIGEQTRTVLGLIRERSQARRKAEELQRELDAALIQIGRHVVAALPPAPASAEGEE